MRMKPAPSQSILATEDDMLRGVRNLKRRCEVIKRLHRQTGTPKLRRAPTGFAGLAKIVVGQQLSIASAAAIWRRVSEGIVPFEPEVLLQRDDGTLAALGLSRPKIRTLKALAEAIADGSLDLKHLERAPDEAVHAALTAVTGIGPWTADIYLMFCLGRADSWAPGDLALQVAVERAFGMRGRPDRGRLEEIAERWRPWRAVAAHVLWAYYALPQSDPNGPPARIKRTEN